MKFTLHFHLYSRLMVVAVLAMMVFALQRSVDTRAEVLPASAEIDGWAWSPVYGWMNFNCLTDLDGDQILDNRCLAPNVNYKLTLENDAGQGYIRGCAWAGSSVGQTDVTLGWVCFSDPGGTKALPDGVPIVADRINALDYNENTGYASIVFLENLPGGWEAYKLGFPIQTPATPTYPLEGCVNCYAEYTGVCDITGAFCVCPDGGTSCTNLADCPQTGNPLQDQICIVTATENKCDNCLQYEYYSGRCEDGGGAGSHNSCLNSGNCPAGETCEPISTCSVDIDDICANDSDCTNPQVCVAREIDELKRTTGGFECSTCTINSFDNDIEINAYGWNNNSCNSCLDDFYTPGVIFDNNNGYIGSQAQTDDCTEYGGLGIGDDMQADDFCERVHLGGWAWNAWTGGGQHGLGWFQFSPRITSSTSPYFSVERGSIYTGNNIFGRYAPPAGRYNASYLIEAGGTITNFISESTLTDQYQGEIADRPWTVDFLNPLGTHYANALGSLDYLGLITIFDAVNTKNKYGSEIIQFDPTDLGEPDTSLISAFGDPLGGKVFYASTTGQASTNLDIDTPLTIEVGSGLTRASAIVVVDGDLHINSNITYGAGAISNLMHIPSLVWIVRGDVTIATGVSEVAGTFIILGDGVGDCSGETPGSGCGQFISGKANLQLKVYGNVLARRFNLERTFYSTDLDPAEVFYNDGRLQANPPLGLTDFSRSIPKFTETVN